MRVRIKSDLNAENLIIVMTFQKFISQYSFAEKFNIEFRVELIYSLCSKKKKNYHIPVL